MHSYGKTVMSDALVCGNTLQVEFYLTVTYGCVGILL